MSSSKVKTLSIISIILGALGLLGVFTGAVTFFVGPRSPTKPIGGMTAEQLEINQAMTKAFLDLHNGWKVYSAVELILSLVVVVGLIAGGIMSLRVRPQGRSLLVNTFVLAIPLKVVQAVCSVLIGVGTMEIMHEFTPKMMKAAKPAGVPGMAGVDSAVSGIVEASVVMGIVLGVGWILLQLGFYLVGLIYLRKPEVRATFGS